jgi:heptosyltransferase-2
LGLRGLHVSSHLHDRIGLDSLTETIGLLTSAQAVVTHDSGPLHIAGLTHVPIVTLFGPTDPHARVPARANTVALWGGEAFACRPCYDGRSFAPCAHNGCIRELTPAMVLAQVERLLGSARSGVKLPLQVLTPLIAAQAVR